jgi:adenylate cyclase
MPDAMIQPLLAAPTPSVATGRLRLASGLVLMAFLGTHLLNHALGLVSLDAMDQGARVFALVWRTPPGAALLYGAFFVHVGLVLAALYRRRTLKVPLREGLQLALGLAIPFLLISHVVGTRVQDALGGEPIRYSTMVRNLWYVAPENGIRQTAAVVVAWLHGCIGVAFWLRSRAWWTQAAPWLLAVAVLLPATALLGFAQAAREIGWHEAAGTPVPVQGPSGVAGLDTIRTGLQIAFLLAIGGVLAARYARGWLQRHARVAITYPGGRSVMVPHGVSVLEASRIAGLPHASACGGRGRCSTCRVRVTAGLDTLPAPSGQERATLARIKAAPYVRLACQIRPRAPVAVQPILRAGQLRSSAGVGPSRASRGREREVAVLFCDLRGFTRISERRLPFDTVYLLNRYFDMVGHAVEEAGGHLDKFIGDGALALFGLEGDPETAGGQAISAAVAIRRGIDRLNADLRSELDHPLRVAMSVHLGPAVVGEMGYGHAVSLTAVGDTINVASRLEGLAKERDADLVVSEPVAQALEADWPAFETEAVPVRGRRDPVRVFVVTDATALLPGAVQPA